MTGKKKLYGAYMYVLSSLLLAQFSSQQSSTGHEKPNVNFFGELKDQSGNTYNVENITISGLYKQVPFYKVPPRPTMNPDTNTTRIDLEEIYQISVPYKGDVPKTYTLNKREYIEIEVTYNDSVKTKSSYIIEKRRKLYCDQLSDAGIIQKELSFEAVDYLIIKGHREHDEKKSNKLSELD